MFNLTRILRSIFIQIIAPLWYLFSFLVPKRSDYIAINAFPDFDDTVRAFSGALSNTDKTLIVLTCQKNVTMPNWIVQHRIVVAYRYSLQGIWLYHRSPYIFYTHGLFSCWKTSVRQRVINIWHGMPTKKIGLLDGKDANDIVQFDYTIAYNEQFRPIMAAVFGVPEASVYISLHPRIDIMSIKSDIRRLNLPPHKFLTVWLPTYRQSIVGDIRIDGDILSDIFDSHTNLLAIDRLLKKYDCVCIAKPHPMSKLEPTFFSSYTNIIYINDSDMRRLDITLYQLLAMSNFMITDISSVYFDYKLLNRPMLLYCPDLESYKNTRGFVAPIETLIKEEIVIEEAFFIEKLESLFLNNTALNIDAKLSGEYSVTKRLLAEVCFDG